MKARQFIISPFLLAVLTPSSEAWMRTTLADRLMGRFPMSSSSSSGCPCSGATSSSTSGGPFCTMQSSSSSPSASSTHLSAMRKSSSSSSTTSSSSSSSTKQNQREMIEFMEQPVDSTTAEAMVDPAHRVPPEQDPVADLVRCIVKAADGRKADDIAALRVSHVSTLTTFLVILSGNSRPQNQAIATAITKSVQEEFGYQPGGSGVPEGSPESGWMVLDYGSVMVHIMTPKSRLYYNVEGQWREKGGEYMDLSSVLVPNAAASENETGAAADNQVDENDPFWS